MDGVGVRCDPIKIKSFCFNFWVWVNLVWGWNGGLYKWFMGAVTHCFNTNRLDDQTFS